MPIGSDEEARSVKRSPDRPIAQHYVCSRCGSEASVNEAVWRCHCGESFLRLKNQRPLRRSDLNPSARGLARYLTAFPLDPHPPVYLGEGNTPLVPSKFGGCPVYFKLDYLMPSGSFKDRGSVAMVTHLLQRGVQSVIEDSSGNAGASIATYCSAVGIACKIFVPDSASFNKLLQIAAAGGEVIRLSGSREDIAEAAAHAASQGHFYASHNRQPYFVEGLKTLAFELWEQFDFKPPENIVVPLGGGSNLLGCYLGFRQLLDSGEIARMPRLFGIQAASCAPIYSAWVKGEAQIKAVPTDGSSHAEGVMINNPVRGTDVLSAVQQTGGAIVAVEEGEIVAALLELARLGFLVEPTAALAAAGYATLLANGLVDADTANVVVLTGTGLKSSSVIARLLETGPKGRAEGMQTSRTADPDAELIRAMARQLIGVSISEGSVTSISEIVARLVSVVAREAERIEIDSDPNNFYLVLEQVADRKRKAGNGV